MPQQFGFLLLPGFGLSPLAGALDALAAVNPLLEAPTYRTWLLAPPEPLLRSEGGLTVQALPMTDAPALDAVFVVAGPPCDPADAQAVPVLNWLRYAGLGGALMGGLDGGASWLAEAGLLRGHRAAIHWPHIATLADRHVDTVVTQNLYEIDRGRLTCAGHQASLDLLVAWLGQRHGDTVQQALMAALGLERLRSTDERQRVPLACRLGSGSAKLNEAVSLMEANLAEPLPTEEIARLVGVSRRQLERLFRQHLDALPSRWYLELRLERARRLLRQTSQSVLQIGLSCGFASGSHFSNAYRAHFGHTPRDERSQRAVAWRTPSMPTAAGASGGGTPASEEDA